MTFKNKLIDFYNRNNFEIIHFGIPVTVILILIGVFIDFGHRNSDINAGYVVNKDYSAPWIQTVPVTVGKLTTMQTIYHSECYGLTIEDRSEEEYRQNRICVKQSIYNATKQGEFIDLKGKLNELKTR